MKNILILLIIILSLLVTCGCDSGEAPCAPTEGTTATTEATDPLGMDPTIPSAVVPSSGGTVLPDHEL